MRDGRHLAEHPAKKAARAAIEPPLQGAAPGLFGGGRDAGYVINFVLWLGGKGRQLLADGLRVLGSSWHRLPVKSRQSMIDASVEN